MNKKSIFLIIIIVIMSGSLLYSDEDYCSTIYSKIITVSFGVETGFDPNDPNVFDEGHVHMGLSFTADGWDTHIHSETDGREVAAEKGFLHINEIARWNLTSVPAGYEFIGITPGEDFWILNDYEVEGLLFLGLGSESDMTNLCQWDPNNVVKNADWSDKWIAVRLAEVQGPQGGELSMWQNSGDGPIVYFSTLQGGLTEDDSVYLLAQQHCFHANWAFTKPGYWQIKLELSTVYRCDGSIEADIDGNCHVDLGDFAELAQNWLGMDCHLTEQCGGSNLNELEDDEVNIIDMIILADHWLECGYPGCGD